LIAWKSEVVKEVFNFEVFVMASNSSALLLSFTQFTFGFDGHFGAI
jgi:hypothetical protein